MGTVKAVAGAILAAKKAAGTEGEEAAVMAAQAAAETAGMCFALTVRYIILWR